MLCQQCLQAIFSGTIFHHTSVSVLVGVCVCFPDFLAHLRSSAWSEAGADLLPEVKPQTLTLSLGVRPHFPTPHVAAAHGWLGLPSLLLLSEEAWRLTPGQVTAFMRDLQLFPDILLEDFL